MHEGVVATPAHSARDLAGAVFPNVASLEALGAYASRLNHIPAAGGVPGLECATLLDCVEVHILTESTTPIPISRFFGFMRVFIFGRVCHQQRGKPDMGCGCRESASICGGAPAT